MSNEQIDNIIRITGCQRIGISPRSKYDLAKSGDLEYEDVWLVFSDRTKNRDLTKSEIRELKLIDLGLSE